MADPIIPPAAAPVVPPPVAPAVPPAAAAAPVVPPAAPVVVPPVAVEKLRVLREQAQLAADRAEFVKQNEVLAAKQKALDEAAKSTAALSEAMKSKDPAKLLAAAGYTPEEIAQKLAPIAAPADPKVAELERRLSELDDRDKTRTEKQRTAEEQDAREEALAAIAADKDGLPFVNALNLGDRVLTEMFEEHKKSGKMDYEATAKAVEARAVASMPAYLDKLLATPALRTMVQASLAKLAAAAKPADAKVDPAAKAVEAEKKPDAKAAPAKNTDANGWVRKDPPATQRATPKGSETWAEFQARRAAERKAAP